MNEMQLKALAAEIAHALVTGQFTGKWWYWLGLISVTFLTGVIANFVAGYIKKRGENYATKADFDSLLEQLKASTRAQEEIKASIAHADWADREMRTLKRVKLEELMEVIYEVQDWVFREGRRYAHGEEGLEEIKSPLPKAERIASLYFPELEVYVHQYGILVRIFLQEAMQIASDRLGVDNNADNIKLFNSQYMSILEPSIKTRLAVIKEIEKEAKIIMNKLIHPQ